MGVKPSLAASQQTTVFVLRCTRGQLLVLAAWLPLAQSMAWSQVEEEEVSGHITGNELRFAAHALVVGQSRI